jgi:hypothetical protein
MTINAKPRVVIESMMEGLRPVLADVRGPETDILALIGESARPSEHHGPVHRPCCSSRHRYRATDDPDEQRAAMADAEGADRRAPCFIGGPRGIAIADLHGALTTLPTPGPPTVRYSSGTCGDPVIPDVRPAG